ncbi:MAG: hypothetical protein KGD67_01195 [Candidatus Lokiarchaeota archaeon]|nr:hypothetical protein [Candidatus Lokiarchaeota archaeon]
MNKQRKACLFLMIICLQTLFMGFNVAVGKSTNNPLPVDVSGITPKNYGGPHSSPFYFPTNQSTPLMTEEAISDGTDDIPKQSSYDYINEFVLTLNLDKYVLTPGEGVSINLALSYNLEASVGQIITIEIYDEFYRDFRWYDPYYYDGMVPVYTTEVITDNSGQASLVFSSTSDPGIYTIYAYVENCKSYREFTVGDIGIFCKGPMYFKPDHPYTAAVHVVNISDFSGIPLSTFNYSLSYYDYSISNWLLLTTDQIQTDSFGYGIFNVDIPLDENNYHMLKLSLVTSNGEAKYETYLYKSWDYYYYSLWGGEKNTNQEKMQYVVTTDKTIYSPSDSINLRVLVLEYSFMNESKRASKNKPISLTIYNPDDLAIFWTSLITDEHGIITYTLPLDEDCELGNYGFEFGDSNSNYRYDVKVNFYTKPVFRVEIDTNGKEYYSIIDNDFEGYVYASYYFGQPVVGASVELTIYDYQSQIKKTIQGHTNGEGKFHFSINLLFISDLEYSFSVQADVVDTYGRSASIKQTYSRIESLYAYGYLSNWAPDPKEYTEYYFYVYQYIMSDLNYWYGYWNYNPLANVSVNIEIYGIQGYPLLRYLIANKNLLATYSAKTNKFGSGKLEFKLPLNTIKLYDLFEIRLNVKLDDKRSDTSSYYYRYKKYSLDINITDDTLNPGDTLEFEVSYEDTLTGSPSEGEGIIYIYDTNHQLIGRAEDMITGSKTYQLTIPNFSPEGLYYIYSSVYSRSNDYYGGFSYHSAHESFRVGTSQSISFTTNYTNTGKYYDEIEVNQGEFIKIDGITNVTANLPLYIEIYKRGLIYSDQLQVNSGQFTYNLQVIADFVPDFTVIIYTISNSGKLYEGVLSVHVKYSYGFDLSTDKEIYEPGDEITLTISPSENQTSIFAISFIDSAVLDVEPEDDSELGYFTMNSYSTYINSGSSWGSGFDANSYWWFWCGTPRGGIYTEVGQSPAVLRDVSFFAFESLGAMPPSMPSFEDLLREFDTDIRKNISESANWMPKMIISEPTNLTFKLPDNIGEWTIRVVGSSLTDDNNNVVLGGAVESIQIKTFLPFFVEFELPQTIAQDDILSVKGYVYNYIGEDTQAYVAIEAPNLIVLNNEVQQITIPNGFVSEVEFSVYCKEPYLQNITLLAATDINGNHYSDAKQLTAYIKPNGIEITNRTIGFLNASDVTALLNFTLDPLAIYHRSTIALYTDLMDISIDSWNSLIGYPYGCIEQTISKLLPTALIYQYLNRTGQLTSILEKKILLMVLEGISRIYNFQHLDGGWGWWHSDGSKIIMTAIVVSALNQVEEAGFPINPQVIKRGINYLISKQHSNGEWDFQQYSSNTLEATAYVLKALLNSQNITIEIETSVNSAIDRFEALWNAGEMNSVYAASLYYVAIVGTSFENATFNDILIQFIKDNKKIEANTVYWDSDQENIWYWRKLGNEVEITAYATLALAMDDFIDNYATIQKATQYLMNKRNRWGWRTTADTAAAITVLTGIKNIATTWDFVNFNGSVSVSINDEFPSQYNLNLTDGSNHPDEILLNINEFISVGINTVNITLNGNGQICYILETTQILRSNPVVEVPDMIEVSRNENFNLPIKFLDIDGRMPIVDSEVSLINLPNILKNSIENYMKNIPYINNGSELIFSLMSPDISGVYYIEGVSISGFVQFLDTTDNLDYQMFQRTIGPIVIIVSEELTSSSSVPLIFNSNPLFGEIPKTASNDSELLTITKELSKHSYFLPGDLISTTITISNDGEDRQFYVVEDELPTGTLFLSDTVSIISANSSEITYDLYSSGIHFFFPILPTGVSEITYQLQVGSIKNSYSGQCRLWGMYDDVNIIGQSISLENIPRKYYTNHSIYQDLTKPTFSGIEIVQDDLSSMIELLITINAQDKNGISKIRVIFSQNYGWRARTMYSLQNQESFSLRLADFDNIDSDIKIFLEIFDSYGNIASTNIRTIKVIEVIPYFIIGAILGFSIGLASLMSFFSKKQIDKKRENQEKITEKREYKTSFLDLANNVENDSEI